MKSLDTCLELIRRGELKEALDVLASRVRDEDSDLRNSVIQIMARFRRLERERRLGIRPEADSTIELNQITYHAIDLIGTIRSDGGFRDGEVEEAGEYAAAKTRILFVAASPDDAAHLHLDVEMREIEAVLRAATYRDRFELHKVPAARPNDLLAAMVRIKPHFFHFSGHGVRGGIWFLDHDHQAKEVSKESLGEMFRLFRNDIGCAFLNACFSMEEAEAICKYVPCVIGTSAAIPDTVAIQYSRQFYQAIGEGEGVEYAFEFAKMSVGLNGMPGEEGLRMALGSN